MPQAKQQRLNPLTTEQFALAALPESRSIAISF